MRILAVFLVCFCFYVPTYSQELSPSAEVSLITCGSGDELYSTFGHSALRFLDRQTGLDRVYNYGTFDFDTPNFYLLFAQGKLNYFVTVSSFEDFVRSYQRENRWVYSQTLNLSGRQKEALFAFLETNLLPENRNYQYDFLYDNCSTRLRDALETALGDSLIYPETNTSAPADTTFRNMLDLNLTQHPWSDLGIDLALGMPCDKVPDFRERMFLPDYLKNGFGKAALADGNVFQPLVTNGGYILLPNEQGEEDQKSILWIFWVFCALVAAISIFGKAERWRWFDAVFFSLIGFLGIALFLLWFATDHSATKWNLNLLWASPSWLILAFQLVRNRLNLNLFKGHAIAMFAILVVWMLLPQNFHAAAAPLTLSLAFRAWSWQKFYFKRTQSV